MQNPALYQKLTEVFHDVFDDDSITVTPGLSAKDVDGWDSLAHIRLIVTVEKTFQVRFSTTEIGSLKTVSDLVHLIQVKR
jgi:acyl carrier protein